MTEFETEIAEAFGSVIPGGNAASYVQVSLLAPRVAAAIEVLAKQLAEEVENEHGIGRVPGGELYQATFQQAQEEALAALRGIA